MVRDDRGLPVILELEMTEPSVFFAHAPGSAERFARVLLARCRS
jgi:O-ureido-D-serine cyclo-ligase